MLGFVAPRLVLMSMPKTGTTALEAALADRAQLALRGRPEIKHLTMTQYLTRIEPLLRNIPGPRFRVVAAIRDPLSWLGSWYRYRQRPQLAGSPNSTAGISFEGFIQDYLSDDRPRYADLGRQSGFLAVPAEQDAPETLLFQYEQIDLLTDFLAAELKMTISLARLNVSPPGDDTLTPATAERLRATLAEDYALWESARRSPAP